MWHWQRLLLLLHYYRQPVLVAVAACPVCVLGGPWPKCAYRDARSSPLLCTASSAVSPNGWRCANNSLLLQENGCSSTSATSR